MSELVKAQTVKLGGKDYVMVAGRLLLAHSDNERMDVITEIVSMTDQAVVVKATVTTRKGVFTGHAVSLSSGKGVEGQKPLETAETSAVGRALGYAGYAIEGGIASADEVQAAQAEQEDRPARRSTPTPLHTAAPPAPYNADPDAALRPDLDQRLSSAVVAAGRDLDKVRATILRKHGGTWATLPIDTLERACEYYEGEAALVAGEGGAA